MFLEISQNSQENTCASLSFFIKKETPAQVFSCEFYDIFKNTFSYRISPVAVSVNNTDLSKNADLSQNNYFLASFRWVQLLSRKSSSSSPELLLGKKILKICSKFTGDHQCQIVISIKLLCSFTEIALWHGCFPVD